jgi:hypothetical protein
MELQAQAELQGQTEPLVLPVLPVLMESLEQMVALELLANQVQMVLLEQVELQVQTVQTEPQVLQVLMEQMDPMELPVQMEPLVLPVQMVFQLVYSIMKLTIMHNQVILEMVIFFGIMQHKLVQPK